MLTAIIPTPLGEFQASADQYGLSHLLFPGQPFSEPPEQCAEQQNDENPVFLELKKQLNEYLQGIRQAFNLTLSVQGTVFQKTVWEQLTQIPYGDTTSYGKLAEKLGSRNKARAVGGAAHVNPIPVIIPCHRLVGANGQLTGFAGGLKIKKYLLDLERKTNENQSDNR